MSNFISKSIFTSTLLAFVLLFTACSSDEAKTEDANAMVSTNEYVLTGLDNAQYIVTKTSTGFKVKGAENKIVVFDIFATWCPPCQAGATHLTSLQEKYKDEILILGISVEDGIENAKLQEFRKEFNAHYAMVNSSENRRLISSVASNLKIGRNFGIPLVALYKDAKLINFYQGATEEEFIESDIKRALGK